MTSRWRLPAALGLVALLAMSSGCTSRPEASAGSRSSSAGPPAAPSSTTAPSAPGPSAAAAPSGTGPGAGSGAASGAVRVSGGFPSDASAYPTVPAGLPELGPIPVGTSSAGYRSALAAAGGDGAAVTDAVAAAAQVARTALAGCTRWTTGALDPALGSLLAPGYLTRVRRDPAVLLPPLPAGDGAGHDLRALVRGGCDDSAVLRYPDGPLTLGVDGTGLTVAGGFRLDVAVGHVAEHAAQRWTFTLVRTPAGWQVTGATAAGPVAWTPR